MALVTTSEGEAARGADRDTSVLLAWRRLEIRSVALDLVRQPIVGGTLAVLLAGLFFGARWTIEHESQFVGTRFGVEAAGSALTVMLLARVIAVLQARGPLQGVFFHLVAKPQSLLAYWLFETSLLWLTLLICATSVLACLAPARLPGFLAATALGAMPAAALLMLKPGAVRRRPAPVAGTTLHPPSLRGRLLLARIQWRRKVGPISAWKGGATLALITLVAAALARSNNANADVSQAILTGGALAAGAIAGRTDPQLVGFLGHEPMPLSQIVASVVLPTSVVVASGALVTAVAMGSEAMLACALALGVAGLLAVYHSLAVLHALAGRRQSASFAAGVDLTICMTFLVYPPLLWVWTLIRVVTLIGQARRRRWMDF